MKTYRQLRESSAKVAVITFGRFNPPTIGHEKMIQAILKKAKRYGGDPYVFASGSQDAKKNPLPYDEKMMLMRKMFPTRGYNIFKYAQAKVPTVMHAASKLFEDGYEDLVMVVGSDRVGQFKKLLPQYNGVENKPHGFYNFNNIKIESAGERDPDADGAEGMSASKMREFAVAGDLQKFKLGLPNTLSDNDKRDAYSKVRKHMRVKVVENIIEKRKVDIVETKEDKITSFDDFLNYIETLPYNRKEALYVEKINTHVRELLNETEYDNARNHVFKIKDYVNVIDEGSGMFNFEYCDMSLFDNYLDNYERPEFVLKPLNERLKQTVTEGEFETMLGVAAAGVASKLIYDKIAGYIRTKVSVKAKLEALDNKIDSLKDRAKDIDDPKRRAPLAAQIARLEDEKSKIRLKLTSLNKEIEAAREKDDEGGEKQSAEREKERGDAVTARMKDMLGDLNIRKDRISNEIKKMKNIDDRTAEQEKTLQDLISKRGSIFQKAKQYIQKIKDKKDQEDQSNQEN